MIIVGKSVAHCDYGVGVVVDQTDDYIHIDFKGLLKWYQYPTSFEKFLTAIDSDIQSILISEISSLNKSNEEQATKKETTQDRKLFHSSKLINNRQTKFPLRKNVAFKCTYCDGGKPENHIGFSGVCSNAIMRYNVYEKKQVWCSDSDCPCSQYLSNEISRAEIDWPCTESRLLLDWRADAGYYQNGEKRGQPIAMKEVTANSLCVLTTRKPNTPEEYRVIFGVFLIDEAYEGDTRESGFVTTESDLKIFLSDSEAREIPFWKYHYNPKNNKMAHWGTGLFRYVDAEIAAMILYDIAGIKKGTTNESLADRLLKKFCEINNIDSANLPSPYGALTKKVL